VKTGAFCFGRALLCSGYRNRFAAVRQAESDQIAALQRSDLMFARAPQWCGNPPAMAAIAGNSMKNPTDTFDETVSRLHESSYSREVS
jgi:hypothetical protein